MASGMGTLLDQLSLQLRDVSCLICGFRCAEGLSFLNGRHTTRAVSLRSFSHTRVHLIITLALAQRRQSIDILLNHGHLLIELG